MNQVPPAPEYPISIAGHRHRGRCRRHRHSGILYLSPPQEHSGTGLGGSPYSGTGLVPASAFLFIPVPDWLDVGQSDIPAFKKGVHPARPYCWWWWKGYPCSARPNCRLWKVQKRFKMHVYRQLVVVLFLLYYIEKSYVNAGMSECRRKVGPASAFLPVVSCISSPSVFRHQGSVRYRWSRIIPAFAQLVPFRFFSKILGDIRSVRCTTGVL